MDDQRNRFARDRDRLLYSSAFQRLAGITQVVRVGEADFFHTRQQHTIKVAQVGRRLAERCIKEQSGLASEHGLDPEVVEAACIAHDLGHPPFGHIGEKTLNALCRKADAKEGYEGNAQTFRIITKLSVRHEGPGLDLTRATLAATLKYPWVCDPADEEGHGKKWSAYASEKDDFEWARKFHSGEEQTAEAALMDWADDIAYSVHDLEDCHRANLIPWAKLFDPRLEAELVAGFTAKWRTDVPENEREGHIREAFRRLKEVLGVIFRFTINEPYNGCRNHRLELRTLTSTLIGRFLRATELAPFGSGAPLAIKLHAKAEVAILKQLTWDYIISTPALSAQQHGQKRVIQQLFFAINGPAKKGKMPDFTPPRLEYLWDLREDSAARFTADFISSLTERQAVALWQRLTGSAAGSVLDRIVL